MNFLNVQHDQEQLDRISAVFHLQLFHEYQSTKSSKKNIFFFMALLLALTMQAILLCFL